MKMTRQDTAEYALESLLKAGADKAACRVACARTDEFNVEAGKFSLMRTLFNDELYLKAISGGRKGIMVSNKLDKDSIDRSVADCVALFSSASADDAEDIAEKSVNKSFDRSIGGPDMDGLFNRSKEYVELLGDEYPKIVLEALVSDFHSAQTTFLNSNGVEFNDNREFYRLSATFLAKDGATSSSFNGYDAILASLDVPFIDLDLHRSLIEESVASLNTRTVDGKFVGKVIVTPACSDMIWDTLLGNFLSDAPLVMETSRWKDSLGTQVSDPKLTMRAAPLHPCIVAGERFTSDGYESFDTDYIRDGVLKSFALSQYGSLKTGKPRALNTSTSIEVLPGNVPLSDMIKGIDRGILLNRFSGGSPGPGGDISGVAKNSFLIEKGAIVGALSETMVSFNIVDVLQNISAISAERCCNGINVLPWCCFDGITISGK